MALIPFVFSLFCNAEEKKLTPKGYGSPLVKAFKRSVNLNVRLHEVARRDDFAMILRTPYSCLPVYCTGTVPVIFKKFKFV